MLRHLVTLAMILRVIKLQGRAMPATTSAALFVETDTPHVHLAWDSPDFLVPVRAQA